MESAQPRVLVVEANEVYASVIAHIVGLAGAATETVGQVEQARVLLHQDRYDLVVLGVGQDDRLDPSLVGELNAMSRAPLILLSESYEESLATYDAGAQQILAKPFVPEALLGAVRAELRGPKSVVPLATRIEIGGLVFDARQRAVLDRTETIRFTKREWELLVLLLNRVNQFVDTKEMLMRGWGEDSSPEQLRTYVGRIRQKLSPVEPRCQLLSERGLGYCLSLSPSPSSAWNRTGAGEIELPPQQDHVL